MSDMRHILLKGGWADGKIIDVVGATCICMPALRPDGAFSHTYRVNNNVDIAEFEEEIKFATRREHSPITERFFQGILEFTPADGVILELGSGTSTYWLAQQRMIFSIECNLLFYGAFQPIYRYVYGSRGPDQWYEDRIIKAAASQLDYCTLLVDGPDMSLRIVDRLNAFLKRDHLFNNTINWFFDDVAEAEVWPRLKEYAASVGRELLVDDADIKPWALLKGVGK